MDHESSPKRFTLSSEVFAKERIAGIKRALEVVKRERPEILSFALFGSLVKGNTRQESDIDMHVYVEAEHLPEQYKEQEGIIEDKKWNFKARRNGSVHAGTFHWKAFSDAVAKEYTDYVHTKLQAELPHLSLNQLQHILSFPISEPILYESLNEIIDSYKKYPAGIDSEEIHVGMQMVQSGQEALKETPHSRIEPNQVLYGIFFLDAGGGLRPYRKLIIDRLFAEGDIGEQIWKDLIGSTEGWEQKISFYDGPSSVHYPRTLAEAREIYGRM